MVTLNDLYRAVLGRNPDPEGLAFWQQYMGSTIDPAEIDAFVAAAQSELPGATYTPYERTFESNQGRLGSFILDGGGGGFFGGGMTPYETTVEIVGDRGYVGDPAEIARQFQLQQERLQIIGYTRNGEPIYNVVTGDWPPTAGADNTVVVTATTTPPATDDTEDGQGGLQTGGSGLLGGTPTGQTGGTGEGTGTGAGTGGTGTGGSGTGTGAGAGGTGGTGGGAGTGDGGGGLDGGLLGGTGVTPVTNTNIPTVFNPEPVEIIDTTDIFTPDIVVPPEDVIPPTITPVTPVTPTVTPVTPVTPTVTTPPPITPPPPPEMISYGGGNFFSVPIQQGFYSERGFEPGYLPFGPGYPTFRSGVAGYTPMVPTGFEFGIPQVFAPRVVFQPGVFDPGIIGEDGTWRPTPKPGTGTTPGTGGTTTPGFNEPD